MKKISILIAAGLLLSSCATTRLKNMIPGHAYNTQKVSRKCYIFDIDHQGFVYRYTIRDNEGYYELYFMNPMGRVKRDELPIQ